ncbi:uncharacterized protein LOC131232270 [Magnolia sinica]|uniref:uncharacterized protein LOC131232270 n=1 Tax=Magnolia sinica TaxID=86752 RepID=UPI0026592B13|nr:uncharacterized protein LOC131232270 [Magnolia sinica]XP_058084490.1 uncharacterized protein LOC131232270 [Magnolia sinica]
MPALALQPFISVISTSSPIRSIRFKTLAYLKPLHSPPQKSSSLLSDTLRLLEWDKVCDSVASFAGTSLGREATKVQLWSMNVSYDESMSLLAETNAAVEMMKYGISGTDFSGLDVFQVKSATERASRGLPVDGVEAMAVAGLLQFADILQSSMKAALKEDTDWYNRFMPLSEMVMQLVINRPLVKSVQQVIDEDGSVKDSASSDLKRARDQVRMLERKLYQLMDNLIRSELNETSSLEVSNIDGRLCIKSGSNQFTPFKGLLLSSGSGVESLVEPISAVPLNDELQRARALVGKAEVDVLSKLTDKMQAHLDDIRNLLNSVIHLDVVTARAKYSLAFGGTYPELSVTRDEGRTSIRKGDTSRSTTFNMPSLPYPNQKEWTLYLRNAYHPLLLQQHRENLQKAKKDVSSATAEIRRRKLQGESMTSKVNLDAHLASLEIRVTQLQDACPVPVDFLISTKTRVLVITGPNTGGKTISLKTVGLAALMAKSGIYVLASEPVKIPWFDSIFADIGDEQSLAQSLSTFSGHLKQIIAIKAQSTSKSLVLLDEVGAGTNPLEGAALGMSILEGFAETGALLTIATTHHGELKTLKYSNDTFENACVEFDEVNLKPTYKILWGVPGRSNAINIAERLGLPQIVLDKARELYGTASAEINEVIVDMERFKQEFLQQTHEAQDYLTRSRELHEKLLAANQRITEHIVTQRYRKNQEISQAAAVARSNLHHKLRQFRASETQPSQNKKGDNTTDNGVYSVQYTQQSPQEKQIKIPQVGDRVHVSSLRKKATVLKVEASKGEIVVQAGNMQLRLKLSDIEAQ